MSRALKYAKDADEVGAAMLQRMPVQKMLLPLLAPKAKVSQQQNGNNSIPGNGCGLAMVVCKDSGVTSIIVKCSGAFCQLQRHLAPPRGHP